MLETAPRAELMRSLGRLVRGLSALFWGLPLGLLVCVYVATNEWAKPVHMLGPVAVTSLLFYGLYLIGDFQKQERIWRDTLDRAKLLALMNTGFAPFIYWYNRLPQVTFYATAVFLLTISGLLFLFSLNQVLQRLAAMLPDETLRAETRVFGNLNISLLGAILLLLTLFYFVRQFDELPEIILHLVRVLELIRYWILVFLVLLPLAMSMTLIWKIKEVIFASVFSQEI
jgi:hypothetical protein